MGGAVPQSYCLLFGSVESDFLPMVEHAELQISAKKILKMLALLVADQPYATPTLCTVGWFAKTETFFFGKLSINQVWQNCQRCSFKILQYIKGSKPVKKCPLSDWLLFV